MRGMTVIDAPAASSDSAPAAYGMCKRVLLVGESLRVYHDQDDRTFRVCELCRDAARRAGLSQRGPVDSPRMRVQPGGSVTDIVDRDALIEDLGKELEYLKQQLGAAHSALSEHSLKEEAVRAITDRLRRQERELERLRREVDPARRAEEQRALRQQEQELRQLREELRRRDEQIARLQVARQAETDPRRMCGFALEAFNSSEHADRMARIARTLDEPTVTVVDRGPSLPRRVSLALVWDIAWYEFEVKLDLGTGRASVKERASGGDPQGVADELRAGNARWRDSGLVLR
jgi:hypothetical protein